MRTKKTRTKISMLSDRDFFQITIGECLMDYSQVFGNRNPIYIEIGSGKGEFISRYPTYYPENNYIGFEVRDKRINNILKKLVPERNPNVRLACVHIDQKITNFLPEASVSGAFIQHPDPWPKKRHFKRRLFNQAFLDALAKVLKPDAFVQVSTDHVEYADWIVQEFLKNQNYKSKYEEITTEHPVLDEHVVTWFEQEQRRLGYAPKFMLFNKISTISKPAEEEK